MPQFHLCSSHFYLGTYLRRIPTVYNEGLETAYSGWIRPKKKHVKNETNFKQATVLLVSDTSVKAATIPLGPGCTLPFGPVLNFPVVYKKRALAAWTL